MNIRGTSPVMIDGAEDREKFSAMCDAAGIDQPAWQNLTSVEAAFDFADEVGYPVLVRPSYVLSGAAMNVAYTAGELARCLQEAEEVSDDKPVVITKFVEGGREIDVDAVADNGTVIAHAVSEHVENAGIHSGDACLMLPTQTIPDAELRLVRDTIGKVAKSLEITGPFNMQLIAKDGKVQIIETNLRASRTFPFSSKTCGADFIAMATRAMVGADQLPLPDGVEIALEGANERPLHPSGYVGVKVPMFSFKRLLGADPTLGVEMASTGEVACYGADKEEAFLKALMSTDASFAMPNRSVLVSMQDRLQEDFLPSARKLTEQGFSLYATEKTARYLESEGISVTEVAWPGSGALEKKDITEMIRQGEIDLVLMFANNFSERIEANYDIRRLAVDFGVPLLTNLQVAELFADAMEKAAKTADGDLVQYLQTKTLKEHYGDRKNIK
jgi:carbamoyl-phosphate synthase (ammonia)